MYKFRIKNESFKIQLFQRITHFLQQGFYLIKDQL